MTLTRSDISASAEELDQFSPELQRLSLGALWANQDSSSKTARASVEPKPQAIPHVWHWRDLRPQALRAAELVGTQQAERRVLQLRNPAITERSATTNTLVSVDPDHRGGQGLQDFPTAFAVEALVRRRWDVRGLATTLALVHVASGRLGGAVYAPLGAALHFAAGVLLAKEAGAIVTDQSGTEWTLNSPICVVAATRELHTDLLAVAAGTR